MTDEWVKGTQSFMHEIDVDEEQKHQSKHDELERKLKELHTSAKAAFNNPNLFRRGILLANTITNALSIIRRDLPFFYAFLLLFRVRTSFPKGSYGLIALLMFEGFLVSQVVRAWFDYTPTCA